MLKCLYRHYSFVLETFQIFFAEFFLFANAGRNVEMKKWSNVFVALSRVLVVRFERFCPFLISSKYVDIDRDIERLASSTGSTEIANYGKLSQAILMLVRIQCVFCYFSRTAGPICTFLDIFDIPGIRRCWLRYNKPYQFNWLRRYRQLYFPGRNVQFFFQRSEKLMNESSSDRAENSN